MQGTIVEYGYLRLFNVVMQDFHQEIIYDSSDSDVLYNKITVKVAGTCTGNATGDPPKTVGTTVQGVQGLNGVLTYQLIEAQLNSRQDFAIYIGTNQFGIPLQFMRANAVSDYNNGPKVRGLSIAHVAYQTFRIQATFEICKPMCAADALTSTEEKDVKVLSNRWNLISDYDDEWREARTVQGQLRISRNAAFSVDDANVAITPNYFRGLTTPVLQKGYDRTNMHFMVTEDGLTLEYSYTDTQRQAGPPAPAVKWSCRHTETCGAHAVEAYSSMAIRLVGPPGVNKRFLTGTAVAIAFTKLEITANTPLSTAKLVNCTLVDHMESGEIEFNIIFQRLQTPGSAFFSNMLKDFGNPLKLPAYNYDGTQSPTPPVYGVSGIVGAFSSYLQNGCGEGDKGYPQAPTSAAENGPPAPTSGGTKEPKPYDSIGTSEYPTYTPLTSASQAEAIYSSYHIDSSYRTKPRVCCLPRAGAFDAQLPSTFVIQLAPPGMEKVVRVEAKRHSAWPVIPDPQENYEEVDGLVYGSLTAATVTPSAPEVGPDGLTNDFVIRAEYVWELSQPVPRDKPMKAGLVPWSKAPYDQTLFAQDGTGLTGSTPNYSKTILNGGG